MRSVFSTTQSTTFNDMSNKQSDLIIQSSRLSPISTTSSEITTLPFITTQSSTVIVPSSSQSPNKMNSDQTSSYSIMAYGNNNKTQLTDVYYTSLLSTVKPLKTTNSQITDTTEKYSTTVINAYIQNTTQNTNIPISNDKLITSPTTTPITIFPPKVNKPKPLKKTTQKNVPSDITMSSKHYNETNTSTEKSINTYKIKKINHNFPSTTEKTKETSRKSVVMPSKPNNYTQRKFAENSIHSRTIINSSDQYMTETPKTINDSELWYNHMNTQNSYKKELNEEQVDLVLKKLIKLLKPEMDKQPISKDSVVRVVTPKLGDKEKLVYIIVPWGRDTVQTIKNEERQEVNMSP